MNLLFYDFARNNQNEGYAKNSRETSLNKRPAANAQRNRVPTREGTANFL